MSRPPVFQVFFTYQDVTKRKRTMADLSLWVKDTGNGLTGALDCSAELFDSAALVASLKQHPVLLESIARDAETQIDQIEILSSEEKLQLQTWNETSCDSKAAAPRGRAQFQRRGQYGVMNHAAADLRNDRVLFLGTLWLSRRS